MKTYTWSDMYPEWVLLIYYFALLIIFLGILMWIIVFYEWALSVRYLSPNLPLEIFSVILGSSGSIFLAFLGPGILSATPVLRVTVSSNRITLNYSVLRVRRICISSDDVIGVFTTSLPAINYTGRIGAFGKHLSHVWFGINSYLPFQSDDWQFFVASRSGLGICIITKDKKIMISCQDAEEALGNIIEILDAKSILPEYPSQWKDSLH